jgi:hypothetical protein
MTSPVVSDEFDEFDEPEEFFDGVLEADVLGVVFFVVEPLAPGDVFGEFVLLAHDVSKSAEISMTDIVRNIILIPFNFKIITPVKIYCLNCFTHYNLKTVPVQERIQIRYGHGPDTPLDKALVRP